MDNLTIDSLSTEDIDKLETVCRKTYLEAEQKLMLAVLEDAVTCFQGTSPNETKKGEPIL